MDHLRLQVDIPETIAATLRNNDTLSFYLSALPGQRMTARIARKSMNISAQYRTERVEADVYNPNELLAPGMYADVHLHLAPRPNVLSVPLDGVEGLGTSVQQAYIVRDGIVHLMPIKTGMQTANRVEILSGLQQGDKVIVGRHTGLSDGEKVNAQAAGYENN